MMSVGESLDDDLGAVALEREGLEVFEVSVESIELPYALLHWQELRW